MNTVYRSREDFRRALEAAKALAADTADFHRAVRVVTHLSWRGPGDVVSWHKDTSLDMIADAAAMGASEGTPMAVAMTCALNAAGATADTDARRDVVKALRAAA
jgi:hypothetical protein